MKLNQNKTIKSLALTMVAIASCNINAAEKKELDNDSIQAIKKFELETVQQPSTLTAAKAAQPINKNPNKLKQLSVTNTKAQKIVRYQQYFKGIPVIGGQISMKGDNTDLNGQLYESLDLNTTPNFSRSDMVNKLNNIKQQNNYKIADPKIELQIRFVKGDSPRLVYLVSFNALTPTNKPHQPVYIFDANTAEVLQHWDNLQHYDKVGSGGNFKTKKYWYGRDGLPPIKVKKRGNLCIMESSDVRLVNLHSTWDWFDRQISAYQYRCSNADEKQINGGFSPMNDAYVFGGIIVDMYKDWYGLHALQHPDGRKMQLIMRVHFGKDFDNAFWDGRAMSFGDGEEFYPLVSLDVAGHEVSHGFTQQHANLEYHDQPGSINESFSDMAGLATRAYLLEKIPLLHQKIYLGLTDLSWGIGETITKSNGALRYLDQPSLDGHSADCLNKMVAFRHGGSCDITYNDMKRNAENYDLDDESRQSYLVHHGSGILNKAFYLMVKSFGAKNAFKIMLRANYKYWTPTSNLKSAGCGILKSADDLQFKPANVRNILGQVGIDTKFCHLKK